MIRMWYLSEASHDNLGLACTGDGLVLGRTHLIERRNGHFVVRGHTEVARLLKCAYQTEVPTDGVIAGLATVAAALNAGDPCLARIAAVHLKMPQLPDSATRDVLEVEDALIKNARNEELVGGGSSDFHKASPDDPKHPGWPAGTPDGKGGQFRPKADAEIAPEVKARALRLAARRALRTTAIKLLRFSAEAAANLMPILDVAADAAMALDVADTVSQFWRLAKAVTAALDFAQNGPRSFEELQVPSGDYEEFSSYDGFVKRESAQQTMTKMFGAAGDGYQYHHIVTQGSANTDNIPAEQLQNTDNIIRLPTLLHEAVNGAYLEESPIEGMNMYRWLQTQPYDIQREEGLKILRRLNILK